VPSTIEIDSRGPGQTRVVGRVLGAMLHGGEVIGLCGPLGAGKTQLAKGLALGLGVPAAEPVTSPTFVLIRQYAGRLTFHHCDAYRLSSSEELLGLGIEEMLEDRSAVIAIEWADRFLDVLPPGAIRVDLEHTGGRSRRIRILASDASWISELGDRLGERGIRVV
jgi:tRNA threonylcarbamoyladenosine biosynthesis protein TsaE